MTFIIILSKINNRHYYFSSRFFTPKITELRFDLYVLGSIGRPADNTVFLFSSPFEVPVV